MFYIVSNNFPWQRKMTNFTFPYFCKKMLILNLTDGRMICNYFHSHHISVVFVVKVVVHEICPFVEIIIISVCQSETAVLRSRSCHDVVVVELPQAPEDDPQKR